MRLALIQPPTIATAIRYGLTTWVGLGDLERYDWETIARYRAEGREDDGTVGMGGTGWIPQLTIPTGSFEFVLGTTADEPTDLRSVKITGNIHTGTSHVRVGHSILRYHDRVDDRWHATFADGSVHDIPLSSAVAHIRGQIIPVREAKSGECLSISDHVCIDGDTLTHVSQFDEGEGDISDARPFGDWVADGFALRIYEVETDIECPRCNGFGRLRGCGHGEFVSHIADCGIPAPFCGRCKATGFVDFPLPLPETTRKRPCLNKINLDNVDPTSLERHLPCPTPPTPFT